MRININLFGSIVTFVFNSNYLIISRACNHFLWGCNSYPFSNSIIISINHKIVDESIALWVFYGLK